MRIIIITEDERHILIQSTESKRITDQLMETSLSLVKNSNPIEGVMKVWKEFRNGKIGIRRKV